ncbi:hypothetical protein PSTG_19689, partial [Puccinia striiformis f. sp. tritici PST-78]
MLEVAPLEEGKEGNKEATAPAKEAVRKGGIENSSNQGKKRTASEDLKGDGLKAGEEIFVRGSCAGGCSRPHCTPKGISSPPSLRISAVLSRAHLQRILSGDDGERNASPC